MSWQVWMAVIVAASILWLAAVVLPVASDCSRRGGALVRGVSLSGYVCVAALRGANP